MKKKLLFLIVFISLNLYPKNNPSLSAPLSSTCAITNSYCYGSNSGSLHIVAVGGQSPYTYSINNGSFQSIIFDTFNLSPGTYNIITKDALGATVFNSVVITEPAILNATVIVSGQNITVNATGGTAPYAYWLTMNGSLAANAQASSTFSNLAPGTYTVSVKDSNGCLVITEDAIIKPPLTAAITITKQIDCNSNASLMATATGGQNPYVYSIDGGATYQAANIFNNLSSGTYTITAKDSQNTIINTKPIIIAPFAPVNGVALITKPVDCSNNSSITVLANAGQAPYNYSFDGGATYTTSNTFYNVPAGNYVCFVRDQNYCVSPAMLITVENYPALKATVSSGTLLCAKDKTSLTVTAAGGKSPYQYSLNDNPYSSNNTYTNVGFGNYGLTIKDANDCLIKVSHTVIEPEPILADFIIDEQTLTINGKGGIAPYQFSVDSTSYQSNNVFNNLSFGNHKILIKDSKGCESNIFSTSIKAYPPLTNLITLTKKLDCNSNAEITIATSGGKAPYTYSLNDNPYQSSNIFSNLSAGIYFVIVKDATNTTSTTNTITVAPPIPITANATIIKTIDCVSNASIKVDASGGNGSYLYSMNGGSYGVSNLFTDLTFGTYHFTVKDSSNCTVLTNDITLIQPTLLTATATKTNITCSGSSDGMISINTAGGQAPFEYSIGYGFQKSNVFKGLYAGTYNVTIRDTLGCLVMISVDIVQPTQLKTTAIITKPIDCLSNAILNITATGGTPPYLYSIDSGTTFASTPIFSIATAGSYSVIVKDNNGCINTNSITIAPFDPLIATTTSTNIKCYGNNTGSITAIVTRGQAPYSYSIGNGFQTSNIFTNLSAGLYNITIKDALGCYFKTEPITIMQPATPIIAILETKDQTITINTSGGTGIIKYAISPDLNVFTTKNTFTNLSPGIYDIVVQDENGCFLIYTPTINAPAPLVNGKSETTIVFKIGQTLADIKLDIPNIKWYLKAIGITSKTSRTTETPLPLNTIIVDGTTYYASQTVNGIESTERLAVTVKSNGSLSTKDFDLANVNYSPNPVKHILTINNTTAIDEIEIFSVSGKSVLSKKINNTHSEIDLSSLSTGVYFLKVKSEGKEKTIKIIKE